MPIRRKVTKKKATKKRTVRKAMKKRAVRKVAKKRAVRKVAKKRAVRKVEKRRASQGRIRVEIEEDMGGGVTITPVSSRVCAKYERHMLDVYGRAVCSAYKNDGFETQQFLDQHPEIARKLERDRYVVVEMDPWEFGLLLGWDAENVEI